MRLRTTILAPVIATAFAVAGASPARASSFALNPTIVTLSGTATAGDFVIANLGQEPLRLSVRAYAWQQTPNDPESLAPSERVPYFPRLLTLAPGASQRIRVGVLDPRGPVERAYRVLVSELPPPATPQGAGAGLHLLERIDVPLFLAPSARASADGAIDAAQRRADGVDVTLSNAGNVHLAQSNVEVAVRDAAGRVHWRGSQSAFYVLAQSRITVHVAAPADALRAARSVDVTWKNGGRPPVTRSFTL
ncbi:MAG TPA: fimbria/pilus periplasmic chaperone [Candidatus Elarobacter sp.]|nr:fimbria/pilus periplasmic chaperone [Candidatus Elarobacter sp.]